MSFSKAARSAGTSCADTTSAVSPSRASSTMEPRHDVALVAGKPGALPQAALIHQCFERVALRPVADDHQPGLRRQSGDGLDEVAVALPAPKVEVGQRTQVESKIRPQEPPTLLIFLIMAKW
jgi:hypothetical protein